MTPEALTIGYVLGLLSGIILVLVLRIISSGLRSVPVFIKDLLGIRMPAEARLKRHMRQVEKALGHKEREERADELLASLDMMVQAARKVREETKEARNEAERLLLPARSNAKS